MFRDIISFQHADKVATACFACPPVYVSGRPEMSSHIFAPGPTRGEPGGEMPMQAGEIVPGWGAFSCMPAHNSGEPFSSDDIREDRSAT